MKRNKTPHTATQPSLTDAIDEVLLDKPDPDLVRVVVDHPGRWSRAAIAGAATIHAILPRSGWIRILDTLARVEQEVYRYRRESLS